MSKDLENKSKKELVEIISQLREKLLEMQGVEAKQDSVESDLPGYAFSIVRDKENDYHLVEVRFNFHTKGAKVDKITHLATKDYALAAHRGKITLFEKVLNTNNVDHLKKEK